MVTGGYWWWLVVLVVVMQLRPSLAWPSLLLIGNTHSQYPWQHTPHNHHPSSIIHYPSLCPFSVLLTSCMQMYNLSVQPGSPLQQRYPALWMHPCTSTTTLPLKPYNTYICITKPLLLEGTGAAEVPISGRCWHHGPSSYRPLAAPHLSELCLRWRPFLTFLLWAYIADFYHYRDLQPNLQVTWYLLSFSSAVNVFATYGLDWVFRGWPNVSSRT